MPKQHYTADRAEKNVHTAFPQQGWWQVLHRGVTASVCSPSLLQSALPPLHILKPKSGQERGTKGPGVPTGVTQLPGRDVVIPCTSLGVSQGPGGHPNCTIPALTQLLRPIPLATGEAASPSSCSKSNSSEGGCVREEDGRQEGRRWVVGREWKEDIYPKSQKSTYT